MHDAFEVIAAEKVKKEAVNRSFKVRQSVMALVQSKRHSSVGSQVRGSVTSTKSREGTLALKSRQEEKLNNLEEKYARVLARQEQLQNPYYFTELRNALKNDQKQLAEAKKFSKQLGLDNQAIETEMVRMQKNL